MDSWESIVARGASQVKAQEVASRLPHPRLREHVRGYMGYRVERIRPRRHRLLPLDRVTVFIDFVAPLRRSIGRPTPVLRTPPVVGLYDRPLLYEEIGSLHGVGIGLKPTGAYALFGVPMRELANVTVELSDLLGGRAALLAERLALASGWDTRFALLDEVLPGWIQAGPRPAEAVAHAWRRLWESAGRLRIGALADEIGCSRRYLEKGFGEYIGLPPKTTARVLRFRRAVSMLEKAEGRSGAQIADLCGYTDQAHLDLDFRALAGCTPTELRAGGQASGPVIS